MKSQKPPSFVSGRLRRGRLHRAGAHALNSASSAPSPFAYNQRGQYVRTKGLIVRTERMLWELLGGLKAWYGRRTWSHEYEIVRRLETCSSAKHTICRFAGPFAPHPPVPLLLSPPPAATPPSPLPRASSYPGTSDLNARYLICGRPLSLLLTVSTISIPSTIIVNELHSSRHLYSFYCYCCCWCSCFCQY